MLINRESSRLHCPDESSTSRSFQFAIIVKAMLEVSKDSSNYVLRSHLDNNFEIEFLDLENEDRIDD